MHESLLALIVLAPLAGFLLLLALGRRLPRPIISAIACGSVFVSFVAALVSVKSLAANLDGAHGNIVWHGYSWLSAGRFKVDFDLLLDPLSAVMILVVTGVGFLIHVYSTGYMHEERDYSRYFALLNLFTFAMLLLVLGRSLPILFVGWEGVGLCSYLLIGFDYHKEFAATAGKKAFIVNRIGDAGFLIGMFLTYETFQTLRPEEIVRAVLAGGIANPHILTAIALCLFVGAVGKSAQIPLFVWLPDAMAGPTPVSALIHAATMVTAGVYMVTRLAPLYLAAPGALAVVAIIGAVTALMAALVGVAQNDIKKVLAYSTVSQLGYMFLGLGAGVFAASIFHLVTHAFFKALLFLGAGSVIHAMSGEQDMWRMGGLRRKIPWTYGTFLVATLAISGFPPFSGFFSKDAILTGAAHSPVLPHSLGLALSAIGFAAALLTSFYMFRLLFVTFHGESRMDEETAHHVHESPRSMVLPLVVLAVLAAIGGLLGIPDAIGEKIGMSQGNLLKGWLEPVVAPLGVPEATEGAHESIAMELGLMGLSFLLALAGLFRA